MKNKVLSMLLAFVMVAGLVVPSLTVSYISAADDSISSVSVDDENSNLHIGKSVSAPNEDGSYALTMEAYATGTVSTGSVLCDVILVLDISTSMKANFTGSSTTYSEVYTLDKSKTYYVATRYGYSEVEWCSDCNAWTRGCYDYGRWHNEGTAYTPKTSASDYSRYHTQFFTRETVSEMTRLDAMKNSASKFVDLIASYGVNHRVAIVTFGNNVRTRQGFTDVLTGAGTLKNSVNGITNGMLENATEHGKGLEQAASLLSTDTDRKQIIILFTDGEPAPSGSNNWSARIVKQAMDQSYIIKNTYGAELYTVSVFSSSSSDTNANMDTYMSAISSNYPSAKYTGTGSERNQSSMISSITAGNRASTEYYKKANNVSDLDTIFEGLTYTATSTNNMADDKAVFTDKLSKYVAFADDTTADDCTVQIVPVTGEVDGVKTWGTPKTVTGLTVTVEGDDISVTGFNFKDNAVMYVDGKWQGSKLVVTFPIVLNDDAEFALGTHNYPTNTVAVITADDETLVELDKSPEIPVGVYTVTYVVDGEQVGETETYKIGEDVTIREPFEKEGFTVSEWSITEDFKMPEENVVITASTTANEYTVTYLVDGQQVGKAETYKFGDDVTVREQYEKEGYTVTPWSITEDFKMPAEDVVIEATTAINEYTVIYKVDGQQVGEPETYKFGENVTIRDQYEKEGYTVSEWSITEDFDMPAHDVVIEAKSSINSYNVIYKVDGQQVGETETYKYGEDVTVREQYEKEGYTVTPWSITEDFKMPAEDVVIEASTAINEYTVTYVVDGKQVGEPETYKYGEDVTVREQYEKEGYTVTPWSVTEDFKMPAEDVVITAETSINSYNVIYKVDGQQVGETEVYEFGESVTIREPFEKEGYTVTPWSITEDFKMPAHDVIIEADSSVNSYTVTYLVDGEQVGETEYYEFGEDVTVREQYEKEGYTVTPWSITDDFTMPAHDVVITAKTSINEYTVTYKVDGEVVGEVETYDFGENVTVREQYEKEGYTVTPWSVTEDFTMPAEDVVIEATTAINEYTVIYKVDGVQVGEPETYKFGEDVTVREQYEKEGYTVTPWSITDDFTMPAHDVVITAKTSINSYNVIYKVDGEQVGETEVYEYGENVTVRDQFIKEGYTVTPWSVTEDFTMPAEDVVIEATTAINSYTVIYKVDGVQVGEPETYKFGEDVTVREQYEKEGYTVTPWSITDDFTMPAHDVTIEAKSSINSYTVIYKVDGEQVGETETYKFGADVTVRDQYVKEGYTVTPWSITEDFKMPAEDVVIEATTAINSYTVTYLVDGEVVGKVETYDFGETVTVREQYEKEGYTVTPWSVTEDFTMPAENVVIEATTSVNEYTVTYVVDGEVVGEVETYDFGETVTVREQYEKEGYTVTPWSVTEDFTMPAENVVITATTTVNEYTVHFEMNNHGEQIDDQTVAHGDKAEKPSDPTEKDYSFIGWYADEDLTTEFDFETPITGDTIVYAKWEKVPAPQLGDTTNLSLWFILMLASLTVVGGGVIAKKKLSKNDEE